MTKEELEQLNATTWEQLHPNWTDYGDMTDFFPKSQFDNCPSCGQIDKIKVVNSTWDDEMASVLCCGWQANGDCPSEAVENWNKRVVASGWVVVADGLPAENGWYLVSCRPPYHQRTQYHYFDGTKFDVLHDETIAWMPTPAPLQV